MFEFPCDHACHQMIQILQEKDPTHIPTISFKNFTIQIAESYPAAKNPMTFEFTTAKTSEGIEMLPAIGA